MIVVPLVFSSLVVGVAGLGDIGRLGRVGLKTLAYTLVFSTISVLIGLGLANAIRPGERISAETAAELETRYGSEATEPRDAAARRAARRSRFSYRSSTRWYRVIRSPHWRRCPTCST